ncbi:MAG: hypothetical protein JOZ65_26010 [Chloroflexi bacterium]|nr:hypothetical protein [Chloroflexota bacterium]
MHQPGEAAQSDFTHMTSLNVTLGGVRFPHLVFHLVLVYSNIEAVQICFSESFEALLKASSAVSGRSAAYPASTGPITSAQQSIRSMPTGAPRQRSVTGC